MAAIGGGALRGLGVAAAVAAALALAACSSITGDVEVQRTALTTTVPAGVGIGSPLTGIITTPDDHAIKGIDVSKYQGPVDWSAVRAAGTSFAYIKSTEGGDRIDDRFAENWAAAKEAGIPRGAYHFYYFCRTGAEQAAWFIRNVPNDPDALPPVLDMEWNHLSPTCQRRPPAAEVQRETSNFLRIVEKHYGKKPIIYTSIDFFDDNNLSTFRGYPYWLRSVAGHPRSRYGSHPFTFWQYTGTGVIPGIKGNADINVFNGDTGAWTKWLRANTR